MIHNLKFLNLKFFAGFLGSTLPLLFPHHQFDGDTSRQVPKSCGLNPALGCHHGWQPLGERYQAQRMGLVSLPT